MSGVVGAELEKRHRGVVSCVETTEIPRIEIPRIVEATEMPRIKMPRIVETTDTDLSR